MKAGRYHMILAHRNSHAMKRKELSGVINRVEKAARDSSGPDAPNPSGENLRSIHQLIEGDWTR